MKKIIIPKDNLKDLEDVPESVKKELEIVSASTVEEVIKEALL